MPNECPEHMPYCACEKKPRGLDVDCSRINAFKLKVVCDELRKVRWKQILSCRGFYKSCMF